MEILSVLTSLDLIFLHGFFCTSPHNISSDLFCHSSKMVTTEIATSPLRSGVSIEDSDANGASVLRDVVALLLKIDGYQNLHFGAPVESPGDLMMLIGKIRHCRANPLTSSDTFRSDTLAQTGIPAKTTRRSPPPRPTRPCWTAKAMPWIAPKALSTMSTSSRSAPKPKSSARLSQVSRRSTATAHPAQTGLAMQPKPPS